MAKALVDPPRGFKADLMRKVIQANPDLSNSDLAQLFASQMVDAGYRDERDAAKLVQAVAQMKSDMKRKAAAGEDDEDDGQTRTLFRSVRQESGQNAGELLSGLRELVRLLGREEAKKIVAGMIDRL